MQPKAKELQHRNTVCSLPQCNKTESVRPQATCNLALTSNQVYSKAKRQQIRSVFSTHVFVVSLFWPCSGSPPCVLMFGSLQRAAQMHFASFVSCGQGTTRRRTASTAAGKRTFKHHQMLRSSKQRQPLLHCQRVEAWQRIQKVYPRRGGVPVRVRRAHNPFWRVRNTRARTYSQTASVLRVASNKQKALAVPRRGGIH